MENLPSIRVYKTDLITQNGIAKQSDVHGHQKALDHVGQGIVLECHVGQDRDSKS